MIREPNDPATAQTAVAADHPVEHQPRHQGSSLTIRRSKGAASGVWLIVLGAWGALIPFIGPYFSYAFGGSGAWDFTIDRLWLNILPGIAVFLGGLVLGPSGNRLSAGGGAWLALVGGLWFLVGPSISQLWGTGGAAGPIGAPRGGTGLVVLEQLGYFYALGALITLFAAGALGRLSVLPGAEHTTHARTDAERL